MVQWKTVPNLPVEWNSAVIVFAQTQAGGVTSVGTTLVVVQSKERAWGTPARSWHFC